MPSAVSRLDGNHDALLLVSCASNVGDSTSHAFWDSLAAFNTAGFEVDASQSSRVWVRIVEVADSDPC